MNGIVEKIRERKLIAIIRGVEIQALPYVVEALYKGGIEFAEITFDAKKRTSDDRIAESIRTVRERFSEDMHIGAGTVLSTVQVNAAVEAGAEFLLSPNVNTEVIQLTKKLGAVSIPGAFTPTEACIAHDAGADMVKLFPVGKLGASYVKAICAPLSHIQFLAVGGVSAENLCGFLKAGAVGAGIGTDIVNEKAIVNKDYISISERAALYRAVADGFLR